MTPVPTIIIRWLVFFCAKIGSGRSGSCEKLSM
nr:MAG TPA: hypothetical protein [Caudoviricetes sp.]